MDMFNLIRAPNASKVKTGTRARTAHEVPLLTATANRVINMAETPATTESTGTPSAIQSSPLDFDDENVQETVEEEEQAENPILTEASQQSHPVAEETTTGVPLKPT